MEVTLSTMQHSPASPTADSAMDPQWVDRLCDHLRQWCGVHLDRSKSYLIENRLRSLVKELGYPCHADLLAAAERRDGVRERDRIVDALTTHETLFFRDKSPFDALATQIVPELQAQANVGKPRLRIWSAACSTGQEPYSIAIKLLETIRNIDAWDLSILATDVSTGTVAAAKDGLFREHELRRGINSERQQRYFEADGAHWRVKDSVRQLLDFRVANLNSPSQPAGPFDVIFCRNVLIYFQPEDANRILRRVASRLAPGGRLIVGCSEVLRGVEDILMTQTVGQATCYRKKS